MVKLIEEGEKRKMALEALKELYRNTKPESKNLHHASAIQISVDMPNIP